MVLVRGDTVMVCTCNTGHNEGVVDIDSTADGINDFQGHKCLLSERKLADL